MYRIIRAVSDNDLYCAHMGDFLFHRYPNRRSTWTYTNRDLGIDLRPILPLVKEQVEMMADLKLQDYEAENMLNNTFCSEEYLEALTKTQIFNPKDIEWMDRGYFGFRYSGITEFAIYWEVALMAVISELWFRHIYRDNYEAVIQSGKDWLASEISWMQQNAHPLLRILEMGGRRRFSADYQEYALLELMKEIPQHMLGTSNMYLGIKHGIDYKGTMAHLLMMFMQTQHPVHKSQIITLNEWDQHFEGKLPVALTDTWGNPKWERDFTPDLMEKFTVERHDSGSIDLWARQRIDSARRAGFDTKKRGLLFSDGLTFRTANENTIKYSDDVIVTNGIGTHITNTMNVPNHKPIPQVSKLTWANGLPTCKLSADAGKAQCEDEDYLRWCKKIAQSY